jgi:hydroxymethylpyrimidine pyrophosphatase-like HAD family hydrolase
MSLPDQAPTSNENAALQLRRFLGASRFSERGGIISDLDGTAVHEDAGRIVIPEEVELGLARLVELGRPLILNTLRFPLSVLRTFGREWYEISRAPLPTITLNGSLLGRIVESAGELVFEETACFALAQPDIERALSAVKRLLDDGVRDVLLFYYPRDWRMGELIWTPLAANVIPVKEKYVSASGVTAVEFKRLRQQLSTDDICMIFLTIDTPHDRLMAYQHSQRNQFFTRSGVDKLSGAREMASQVGVDLSSSIGAGDTDMDRFLSETGCAVIVGNDDLAYRGVLETIRVRHSRAFGDLLHRLLDLQQEPP